MSYIAVQKNRLISRDLCTFCTNVPYLDPYNQNTGNDWLLTFNICFGLNLRFPSSSIKLLR
jgi:hypothetical protein